MACLIIYNVDKLKLDCFILHYNLNNYCYKLIIIMVGNVGNVGYTFKVNKNITTYHLEKVLKFLNIFNFLFRNRIFLLRMLLNKNQISN